MEYTISLQSIKNEFLLYWASYQRWVGWKTCHSFVILLVSTCSASVLCIFSIESEPKNQKSYRNSFEIGCCHFLNVANFSVGDKTILFLFGTWKKGYAGQISQNFIKSLKFSDEFSNIWKAGHDPNLVMINLWKMGKSFRIWFQLKPSNQSRLLFFTLTTIFVIIKIDITTIKCSACIASDRCFQELCQVWKGHTEKNLYEIF